MTHTTPVKLAEKIEKIARLAFDPAAAEGEAVTAARMIVQIARKNGIDFDGIKDLLGLATGTSLVSSHKTGKLLVTDKSMLAICLPCVWP